MPVSLDVGTATVGDMATTVKDIEIDAMSTEGAGEQAETRFYNTKWSTYYGIYKSQPEVKIALDTLGLWTVGKGYTTKDAKTEIILESIRGNGVDTFDTILFNQVVTAEIGGDSYAEIINGDDGTLINLKPLDPASIVVVTNRAGIIIRYEQITKAGKEGTTLKFKPSAIFHLSNRRIANSALGSSTIEALQEIVKATNESFEMQKKVIRRFAMPKWIFYLNTDNQTKITAFMKKADSATNLGENIYAANKVVKGELQAVPSQATMNILPWREHLNAKYWQTTGIPQVVVGSSGEFTESTAKIAYVSYSEVVHTRQRYVMTQVWNQLYLRIELEFPFPLRNELISDEAKDGAQGMEVQPSDTTTGLEGGT